MFHSHVPTQVTTMPRKTTPATSLAGPACATDGVASWPVSAATGSPASATAPVARPTAVDQPAGEIARCWARNRALARAYQVHMATAAQAASNPATFSAGGTAR